MLGDGCFQDYLHNVVVVIHLCRYAYMSAVAAELLLLLHVHM